MKHPQASCLNPHGQGTPHPPPQALPTVTLLPTLPPKPTLHQLPHTTTRILAPRALYPSCPTSSPRLAQAAQRRSKWGRPRPKPTSTHWNQVRKRAH